MADILTDVGATFGLGGIPMDSLTTFIIGSAIFAGIAFIVFLIMWKTKWYKRILYPYQITVLFWDHRQSNPPMQLDKMRKMKKEGVEMGELMKKGDTMPFPSFSELHQVGKKIIYIAHRLETGVWLPVKLNLANPDAILISDLKDMKFSSNMKNVLDRESRFRWQSKSFLERMLPVLAFVGFAIFILIALYANYTYVWTPMLSRVDTESQILKEIHSILTTLRGNQSSVVPLVIPPQ